MNWWCYVNANKFLWGYEFGYSTEISDLQNFDFLNFEKISFFYYMGKCDKSDSAIPNFKNYHYLDSDGNSKILQDECGNSTPYIDEDGNHRTVLNEKDKLFADVDDFIINCQKNNTFALK